MNRQQTITADLYGRLIHRPWCKWGEQEYRFRIAGICPSELEENKVIAIDSAYDEYYLDEIKPILFPSLTAPITVAGYNDGKMFIPIVELALRCVSIFDKKEGYFPLDYCDKWINSDGSVTILFQDDVYFELRVMFTEHIGLICELTCPQKLKWDYTSVALDFMKRNHINYQLLPGEYIPATNEYK